MKRTELLTTLTQLFPAIAKNSVAEELTCFRFDGELLRACDGATMVQTKAPESLNLDCAVPAAKFYKLISNMSADEVELTLIEGPVLKVKGGRTNAKYAVFTEGGTLDNLDFEPDEWWDVPKDLLKSLSRCAFAVSKDASRGALCGVLVTPTSIVASNVYRIAHMPLEAKLERSLVIPVGLINIATKHKITKWGVKKDVVYFTTDDGTVVAGKTLLGDYPDVTSWLKQIEELEQSIDIPVEVDGSLQRHLDQQTDVMMLDKEVKITIDGKKLSLHSEDTEKSYSLEEVIELAEPVDSPITFTAHPEFLRDILNKTRSMSYSDDDSLKFVAFTTDEGFQYMACVERE